MERLPVLENSTRERIQAAIDSHDVVLFMKGNPAQPLDPDASSVNSCPAQASPNQSATASGPSGQGPEASQGS